MSEKIDLISALLAIRMPSPLSLPANPGTYKVQTVGSCTLPEDDYAHVVQIPLDASLTLAKVELPEPLDEIPLLRDLPIYEAALVVQDELTQDVPHPTKDDESVTAEFADPSERILYVAAKDFLPALWKHYHTNLASLRGLLLSVDLESTTHLGEWNEKKYNLAKRAFGHDKKILTGLFDWTFNNELVGGEKHLELWGGRGSEAPPQARTSLVVREKALYQTLLSTITQSDLFPCPSAFYFSLAGAYYLAAFLQAIKDKELPLQLPANNCVILFPDSEEGKAEFYYLDTWQTPNTEHFPLEAKESYGTKVCTDIRRLFRYRDKLKQVREERRDLLEQGFKLGIYLTSGKNVRALSKEDSAKQQELIARANQLFAEQEDLQARALAQYADITEWIGTHKERLLEDDRKTKFLEVRVEENEELVKDFEGLFPGNMYGLPMHLAAIPDGLNEPIKEQFDPKLGRRVLVVERPGLVLPNRINTAEKYKQEPLLFPIEGMDKDEVELLRIQANTLLGPNAPRWLLAQGMTAIAYLYRKGGGYSQEGKPVVITCNDWVDTIKPHLAQPGGRFATHGRTGAFKGYDRYELFEALISLLIKLHYRAPVTTEKYGDAWKHIEGFYSIQSTVRNKIGRIEEAELTLNHNVYKFVTGQEGLPFVLTNTEAMFKHDSRRLDYGPSSQMAVEQIIRNQFFSPRANKQVPDAITTQDGSTGRSRLFYAHIFGLMTTHQTDARHIQKQLDRIFENLADVGVIKEWRIDGRERSGTDAIEKVNLHVVPVEGYGRGYSLSKDKREIAEKKQKRNDAPLEQPKPKRGRPRKSK